MKAKLYITYNPFDTASATPDGLAQQRARHVISLLDNDEKEDVHITFSNNLVIDYIRLCIHQGELDHERVVMKAPTTPMIAGSIMSKDNVELMSFNKNGRYNKGQPVCYYTEALSGLLGPERKLH